MIQLNEDVSETEVDEEFLEFVLEAQKKHLLKEAQEKNKS